MTKHIMFASLICSGVGLAVSIRPTFIGVPLFETEHIEVAQFLQDCANSIRYTNYSLACKGLLAGPIKTTNKILTLFLPTNASLEQSLKAKNISTKDFLSYSNTFAKGHIAVGRPFKIDLPQPDYYELFDYRSMTFALRNISIAYSQPPREAVAALKTYRLNDEEYANGNLEYSCGYGSVQVGGTKANILPAPLDSKPITTFFCIYPIDRPLPF